MYKILKTFPVIADQVSGKVLKELCIQAQLDVWKEPDFTGINQILQVFSGILEVIYMSKLSLHI